jgi:hypothetical protein
MSQESVIVSINGTGHRIIFSLFLIFVQKGDFYYGQHGTKSQYAG